jgi:hypothetical protein
MKKGKLRIIQISGVRGILSVIFVITCLGAGFIGFPSLVLCRIWNYFAHNSFVIPEINLFQGMILWGILAVIYTILNSKHKFLVAMEPKTISGAEMKNILRQARNQAMAEHFRELELQQHDIENKDIIQREEENKTEDKEPIER